MRKVQNRKGSSFGVSTLVRSIQTEGLFFFKYISINTLSLNDPDRINVGLELLSKPVNASKKDDSS